MAVTISVIIPAYECVPHLTRCMTALSASTLVPHEIIVIDDGSTDDTPEVAAKFATMVLSTEGRRGPAFARNLGAASATGDILFFIDADVCVQPDTIGKVKASFENNAQLDALMGSYDHSPASPDFISQYRNLLHSYVHHKGAERASTFWSGCGAIRRALFLEHSGFDVTYGRPAIEDIELGYRLLRAGCVLLLDRRIEVTHLKKWTFFGLVKTDIMDRGVPWTELILRDRLMPNDLNLQLSQRVSVALVFILVALCLGSAVYRGVYVLIPLFVIVFLMVARWWVDIGKTTRPRSAALMLLFAVAMTGALAYTHGMPGLIGPLLACPVLLFVRHRYRKQGPILNAMRWIALTFIVGSVCVAAYYVPSRPLAIAGFAILAALGIMNSQFYIFLAGKRGLGFMLAAIPFHILYHFYSGVSFLIGAANHYGAAYSRRFSPVVKPLVAPVMPVGKTPPAEQP